jgi:hypothetical protein
MDYTAGLVTVIVALIAAMPATLSELNKRRHVKEARALRRDFVEHAEQDAAFQEWVMAQLGYTSGILFTGDDNDDT